MSCKFNVKKCFNCPRYNSCILQSNYTLNLNILDLLKTISNDINTLKNNEETIRGDGNIIPNDVNILKTELSNLSKKIGTLVDSYEIVS